MGKKKKKSQATGSRTQAHKTPLCWSKQMLSPEKHKPQKPTLVHGHSSGPLPDLDVALTASEKAAPREPCEQPSALLPVLSFQAPDTGLRGSLQMAQTVHLPPFVPKMAQ